MTNEFITVGNDDQKIISTNYWQTEQGRAGYCYVTANAGALRLLVPHSIEYALDEMKTGRSVTIEPSITQPGAFDVVFEDGTDSPFSLTLGPELFDCKLTPGKGLPFTIWTEAGQVRTPKLLRATIKV